MTHIDTSHPDFDAARENARIDRQRMERHDREQQAMDARRMAWGLGIDGKDWS